MAAAGVDAAKALLTDDYYESDVAWVELENPKFDLILAPYETYLDELLGVKTSYGAAVLAAKANGAAELIDPRPFAVGSIAETFERYPNVGTLLPAMGYGRKQMEDLRATIERSDAELVLIGTPIDLRRLIELDKPALRVTYKLQEVGEPTLKELLAEKGLLETALV